MAVLEEQLSKEIKKYKMYDEDLKRYHNIYENYKNLTRDIIVGIMKASDTQEFEGVKLVKKKVMPPISVEELKECFNDKSMADLVVVNVDIEKSIDNIMLRNGYNENIARGILDLLFELKEYEIFDLEIKK